MASAVGEDECLYLFSPIFKNGWDLMVFRGHGNWPLASQATHQGDARPGRPFICSRKRKKSSILEVNPSDIKEQSFTKTNLHQNHYSFVR